MGLPDNGYSLILSISVRFMPEDAGMCNALPHEDRQTAVLRGISLKQQQNLKKCTKNLKMSGSSKK